MMLVKICCLVLFAGLALAVEPSDLARSVGDVKVAGGVSNAAIDDPEVLKYMKSSLELLDSDSGVDHKYMVKKIISATKQVVAGSLYKIKAEIIHSDCLKLSLGRLDPCKELSGANPKVCEFTIWDRPWLENGKETTVKCDKDTSEKKYRSRRSPQVFGGVSEVTIDNPRVLEHVKNTLPLLDKDSKLETKLKMKKIVSASHQVVAGFKWIIEVELVPSDCAKNDPKDVSTCGILKDGELKLCTLEIWEKVPKGTETSVKCGKDGQTVKYRTRRAAPFKKYRG